MKGLNLYIYFRLNIQNKYLPVYIMAAILDTLYLNTTLFAILKISEQYAILYLKWEQVDIFDIRNTCLHSSQFRSMLFFQNGPPTISKYIFFLSSLLILFKKLLLSF